MKALRLAALVTAVLFASIYAVADEVMQITRKDGTTAQFKVANIDDMRFESLAIPETPDHEAVDLGLPSGLLWATCNIGAMRPSDYGDYYAWGETELKHEYYGSTSKWWRVDVSTLQEQGVIDAEGNLTSQYDAAAANWGEEWRMPTYSDFRELYDNCSCEWATVDGHNGCLITGSNGNSIFMPASGYRVGDECTKTIYEGDYWSSTINGEFAYYLFFDTNDIYMDQAYAFCGMTIRPVRPKEVEQ